MVVSDLQIFKAMVKIRYLISLRDKMAVFSRIILPVVLILIADVILRSSSIQYNPRESQINFSPDSIYHSYRGRFLLILDNPSNTTSTSNNISNTSNVTTNVTSSSTTSSDDSTLLGM